MRIKLPFDPFKKSGGEERRERWPWLLETQEDPSLLEH